MALLDFSAASTHSVNGNIYFNDSLHSANKHRREEGGSSAVPAHDISACLTLLCMNYKSQTSF